MRGAVVDFHCETGDVRGEDGFGGDDRRGVLDPCEPWSMLCSELLSEDPQVRYTRINTVDGVGLDDDRPELWERSGALLKYELRVPQRVRLDLERPPLGAPLDKYPHELLDLPVRNPPRRRHRDMQVGALRHPQPELRPLIHVRIVAVHVHVGPHRRGVRRAPPCGADVRDDDGRAGPAVGDEVPKNLDEEFVRDAARESDEAVAAFDGCAVLGLVVAQVADLDEQAPNAVFKGRDLVLVCADGRLRALDDLRGRFDAELVSFGGG